MDLNEYLVEMKKAELREIDQQEFERYREFVSSVGCLIAEGSEFMTKEQLYDAIKNAFNRVIILKGSEFKAEFKAEGTHYSAEGTHHSAEGTRYVADGPPKEKDND